MSDETIMPFDFQSGSPSIIKVIGVGFPYPWQS